MALPDPSVPPLTCAQVRDVDVLAIEHVGMAGLVLMENAGRRVAEVAYDALAGVGDPRVVILCGAGNNGGDGFVAARHLSNAGVATIVVLAAPRDRLRGDAAANLRILERAAPRLIDATSPQGLAAACDALREADVIVDALLGTGSSGAPRPPMDALIAAANAAPRARRLAVDIPSGLDADSGEAAATCFRADITVTFVAPKVGFATEAARRVVGRVVVADIGIPRELLPAGG